MTDVGGGDDGTTRLAIAVLGSVLVLLAIDLVIDAAAPVGWVHLVAEGVALAISAGGVALLGARMRARDRAQRRLARRLATSESETEHWRREAAEAVAGLRLALDRQFDRWLFTDAERQVALLLLQGLSHKQIAGRRDASERTVRQQAHMLYRKAGLSSRADLAAYFLRDLIPVEGPVTKAVEGVDEDGATSQR